jgi:hypothetical protein
MIIRLSPSGPPILNAGGGPLQPGAGMQLRLAEGMTTIGGSLAIPSQGAPATIGTILGGGTVLVETLLAPNPLLNYRATLLLDVLNTQTNAAGSVQLFIDTSVDGSTWVEQVGNTHAVPAGSGVDGTLASGRQVRVDMTLRAGSALAGGMLSTAPSLRVRGRVCALAANGGLQVSSEAASGAFTNLVGTAILQLSECF